MNGRFLVLFAVTITLVVLALSAARSAVTDGGTPAAFAFVALALPAMLGLAALVRITYRDGVDLRRRRGGRPS